MGGTLPAAHSEGQVGCHLEAYLQGCTKEEQLRNQGMSRPACSLRFPPPWKLGVWALGSRLLRPSSRLLNNAVGGGQPRDHRPLCPMPGHCCCTVRAAWDLSHGPGMHVFAPQNEAVWRGRPAGVTTYQRQHEDRTLVCCPSLHVCPSSPFRSLWVGRGPRGVAGGSLSAPPNSPCLLPGPALPLPPLQAPGLGFTGLSLAPLRGLGGESAEQQFPAQSRTVLSKSSQHWGAFFSNDSAAREWEGPKPSASETMTKASGMRSRWAHGERGGRVAGLELGVLAGSWGVGRVSWQQDSECCSLSAPCQSALRDISSCSQGAQANGQEMEMEELVSMETGQPVDSRSHVCARMWTSTGQAWQIPRFCACGLHGLGLGGTAVSCSLSCSPPRPTPPSTP